MDACLANPAASIDLHEVLYGMVTPAGPWGSFWGQGLKRMVAPISNIANFGIQAFRNQSRDSKHSSNRSFHSAHSDPDDFSIGTGRSDSDDTLSHTTTSAASNNPLSSSTATLSSSDDQARAEPALTRQNLPEEDQSGASSSPHPMAALSSTSEISAAPNSTAESAVLSAAMQQPSGSSAQTLQSRSPNTVVQAAAPVGVSSNQKRPALKPAKLASNEMTNQPGAQASVADETIAADPSAASSSSASTATPGAKSEQVGSPHSQDLVWHMHLAFSAMLCIFMSLTFQLVMSKCSRGGLQSCSTCAVVHIMSCCKQLGPVMYILSNRLL